MTGFRAAVSRLRARLFGGWSQPPWRRRRRVVRLPIVVAEEQGGRVLTLEVRVLRFKRANPAVLKGPPPTHDDGGMRESFNEALEWAKGHPRFRARSFNRWCLLPYGDDRRKVDDVGGPSAGGAMALALAYLHGLTPDARAPYDRRTVLSGRVTRDGALLGVTKFRRKVIPVAELRLRLLVSPANWAEVQAEAEHRGPRLQTEKADDVAASLALMRIHPSRHPYWMAPLLVVIVLALAAVWAVGRARGERDARRVRELASITGRDARTEPGLAAVAALAAQRLGPRKPEARDALLRVAAVDPRLRGVAAGDRPAGAVAVSADGRRVAVGGDGHRVRVQEPGGGRYRAAHHGGGGVTALAFTPDGRSLISGDENGLVVRWDVTGRVPRPMGEGSAGGAVQRLAVSPDGGRLAVLRAGRGAVIWPWAAGPPARAGLLPHHAAVPLPVLEPNDVAFVDDGSVAVTSAKRGEVEVAVHSASSGRRERVLRPANRSVFNGSHALAVARLADGRRVLAVGRQIIGKGPPFGRVTVWETGRWKVVREIEDPSGVIRLAAGRDGDRLVVGSSGALRQDVPTALKVLDLNTGNWLGPELGGRAMRFRGEPQLDAAGGRLVALTDAWHPTDWSVRPGPALHKGLVTQVRTDPRARGRVITAGMDGLVRVVEVPSMRIVQTVDLSGYGPILALAVTADGKTLLTGHMDGRAVVSDRDGGRVVRVLGGRTPHGLGRVLSMAADLRAGRVAVGDLQGTVEVWELRDGRLLRTVRTAGHGAARTLLFVPSSGELIVGYDGDHAAIVPPVGEPRNLGFPGGLAVAVPLASSKLLVGAGTGDLGVTDLRLRRTGVQPTARVTGTVMNIAVSPDRKTWLVPDQAGSVRVIDADDGSEIAAVNPADGHGLTVAPLYSAAFTGNGRYAAFGSGSGRLVVLGLTSKFLVGRACSLLSPWAAHDPDIAVPEEAHMRAGEALAACK
ncbi:WD40 repeat domain-containing protein [Actinomadura violacea]|uniref:WD40 repeat domain-containing protein n=1 Tax=Actinomadura violacea TaxID=2819934 RepID=A0ABS3RSJ2_9ACTN|nr:hypothetical protein [Actinomadura violacea]MBO2459702.1 hypothetical protein [Actinomadura violacea]